MSQHKTLVLLGPGSQKQVCTFEQIEEGDRALVLRIIEDDDEPAQIGKKPLKRKRPTFSGRETRGRVPTDDAFFAALDVLSGKAKQAICRKLGTSDNYLYSVKSSKCASVPKAAYDAVLHAKI